MSRFPSTVQSIVEEVDSASEWEEEHTKEDTEDKEASEKRTYENVYEYLTKGCYSQGATRAVLRSWFSVMRGSILSVYAYK